MVVKKVVPVSGAKMKKQQGGWTLAEAAITVAIVGVLVAGGFYIYHEIQKSNRATQTVQAISGMVANARNLYSSTNDYNAVDGDSNDGLEAKTVWQNGKLWQKPFKDDGSNILDPWGNTVTFGASNSTFGFAFGGSNISKDECVKITQSIVDMANQMNVGASATISSSGALSGGQQVKSAASGTPNLSNIAAGCAENNRKIAVNFR